MMIIKLIRILQQNFSSKIVVYPFNSNVTALQNRLVQVLNAAVSIFVAIHCNKGKTTRSTSPGLHHKKAGGNLMRKQLINERLEIQEPNTEDFPSLETQAET